jgi:hypothetical protein
MSPEEVISLYAKAPDGPLLVGLSDVDWSAEEHAFGPATEVSALLRALVSPVAEHRDAACHGWFESVNHQGSVYTATLRALPFLIALFDHAQTPDRDLIAVLLSNILAARVRPAFRPMINPFTRKPTERPPDYDRKREAEHAFIAQILKTGMPVVPKLTSYLKHSDPNVRTDIARALANYPDLADQTVPPLREALAAESDDEVREALQQTLDPLTRRTEQ